MQICPLRLVCIFFISCSLFLNNDLASLIASLDGVVRAGALVLVLVTGLGAESPAMLAGEPVSFIACILLRHASKSPTTIDAITEVVCGHLAVVLGQYWRRTLSCCTHPSKLGRRHLHRVAS